MSELSGISVDVSTSLDEGWSPNSPDPGVLPFVNHYVRHNLTKRCLVDTMKLTEDHQNASEYSVENKLAQYTDDVTWIYYVKCSKCAQYHAFGANEKNYFCQKCAKATTLSETNFYVYVPLLQQILKSVENNFDYVLQQSKSSSESISDVHDGIILKEMNCKLKHQNEVSLSLTLNTDGIQMFKNNKQSVWPLQLYQNFIPPNRRYIPENIIVVGLHYGHTSEVDMSEFLRPLNEELNLLKQGFTVQRHNVSYKCIPFISSCTVDLPAKCKVQGFKQFNGNESCGYCYAKGASIKNLSSNSSTVRYLWNECDAKLRDHDDTIEIMRRIRANCKPINGIKCVSPVVGIPHFNVIRGFSIDYMHCVLSGVENRLLDLYFESSKKEYTIGAAKARVLDKRILQIKPPCEITRKPRSLIKFRSDLKANELRSPLLYYLPIAFEGISPRKYLNHFRLLSSSIFVLLKVNITENELDLCDQKLRKFVHDFEIFFGKSSVTMNVHLLLHIVFAVRNLGPLWAQSAFGFETNNGCLIRNVKGTRHVLKQIATNYVLKRKLAEINEKQKLNASIQLLGKKKKPDENLDIYNRVRKNNVNFTSTTYKMSTSSCDYFIEFNDGVIGKANYYYEIENEYFVVFQEINVIVEFDQYKEFSDTDSTNTKFIREIKRKVFQINIKNELNTTRQYLSYIPNFFEKT